MKSIIMIFSMILVLLMTACSGAQVEEMLPDANQAPLAESVISTAETIVESSDVSEVLGEAVQLNTQMRLILGIMSLEQANLNLTSEQAEILLPLWKVMNNMLASDTSAAAEIDALYNQIQSELTAEQLDWVEKYSLTPEAYQAILAQFVPEELLNSGTMMTEEERQAKRATAIAANGGTIPQELQGSGSGRGMGSGSGMPLNSTGVAPGDGQGAGAGSGQINVYLIEGLILELESIIAQ